jgi:hypothetical protein
VGRPKLESRDLSSTFLIHPPELALKYEEAREFEQFYKYKEKEEGLASDHLDTTAKVAGVKIEPFKKYQIRAIKKA